jgi:hypothetical protein
MNATHLPVVARDEPHANLAAQALFLGSGFEPRGSIDNLDDGDPELVFCMLLHGRSPRE